MSNYQMRLFISGLLLFLTSIQPLLGQSDTIQSQMMLGNIFEILKEDSIVTHAQNQSSVAGFRKEDLRETPGAIQVIDSDEIRAIGARDLMDVLMSIPGMALSRDADDVVSVGLRGLWANEGKVLFMLNGIPLNDLDFGIYALGNRLPLDAVSRIEIMNGPGSLVYGGVAALGVVNIITKSPLEMSGTKIYAETSVSNGFSSSNSLGVVSNHLIGKDTYVALQVSTKSALRSTYTEKLADGTPISFGDSTKTNSQNIYLSVNRLKFKSQLYLNSYSYNVSDASYGVLMFSSAWDNSWEKQLNPSSTLKLRTTYQYQLPWFNLNTSDPEIISTNTVTQRLKAEAMFEKNINSHFSLTTGIQGYRQDGRILARQHVYSINNANAMHLNDVAFHSELNYNGKVGIIKIGGRIEKNSFTPLLYSPRIAWNKLIGVTYFKLLWSDAFKIPTVQNINLGPNDKLLSHESVRSLEFTFGLNPSKNTNFELIFFKTEIRNPIVYAVDTIQLDNYINRNATGTEGIDCRFSSTGKIINLRMGYSFYRSMLHSDIPESEIIGSRSYLGLPQHKGVLNILVHFSKVFSINSSVIYMGKNQYYGYQLEATDDLKLQTSDALALLNAGLSINPKFMRACRIQFNVNNIFDKKYMAASPVNNGLMPLPLYARSFTLNLLCRINS